MRTQDLLDSPAGRIGRMNGFAMKPKMFFPEVIAVIVLQCKRSHDCSLCIRGHAPMRQGKAHQRRCRWDSRKDWCVLYQPCSNCEKGRMNEARGDLWRIWWRCHHEHMILAEHPPWVRIFHVRFSFMDGTHKSRSVPEFHNVSFHGNHEWSYQDVRGSLGCKTERVLALDHFALLAWPEKWFQKMVLTCTNTFLESFAMSLAEKCVKNSQTLSRREARAVCCCMWMIACFSLASSWLGSFSDKLKQCFNTTLGFASGDGRQFEFLQPSYAVDPNYEKIAICPEMKGVTFDAAYKTCSERSSKLIYFIITQLPFDKGRTGIFISFVGAPTLRESWPSRCSVFSRELGFGFSSATGHSWVMSCREDWLDIEENSKVCHDIGESEPATACLESL